MEWQPQMQPFTRFAMILTTQRNIDNFAEAHDAASAGDTLYIFGSPSDYGTVVISKPLTIIGAGYNPENQHKYSTTFTKITLENKTLSNASGTTIMGIKVSSSLYNENLVNNITILYCDITISVGMGVFGPVHHKPTTG